MLPGPSRKAARSQLDHPGHQLVAQRGEVALGDLGYNLEPMPKAKHIPPGFTLVELLTVIAVLSLLLSLLAPTLRRSRVLAGRSVCASNLHQLHGSMAAYAGVSRGRLPMMGYGPAWSTCNASLHVYERRIAELLVRNYTGNLDVWFCPHHRVNQAAHWPATWQTNYGYHDAFRYASYMSGANECLNPQTMGKNLYQRDGTNFTLYTLGDQSDLMLLADLIRWAGPWQRWEPADRYFLPDGRPEGSNRAYLDGRVMWGDFDSLQRNYSHGGNWDYYW